ncbi:MAG: MMPL family transporter [Pseudomonadota bacterium]
MIEDLAPADLPIATIKDRAMSDPLLINRILAPDGKTTAVVIDLNFPMSESSAALEALDAAKAMVADAKLADVGLEVWYGGRLAQSVAFAQAGKGDLSKLTPLSFIVIFAGLAFLLRSFSQAAAIFTSGVLATLASLGAAGWAGLQINAATANVPTILVTLNVAALAHLVLSARRLRGSGKSPAEAVSAALKSDAIPITLTLTTTAIGFATLLFADAPPFRELGAICAIGSLLCLAFGMTYVPAFLSLGALNNPKSHGFIDKIVHGAASLTVQKRQTLIVVMPLLAAVVCAGAMKLYIDDTFHRYFSERFEFRRHAELIRTNLTGTEFIDFDLNGGRENAIFEPEYIDKLQRFEAWLKSDPNVIYVGSILDIYARLNQHLTDGDPSSRVIPEDRETLAQYILLYEMSLPLGQDMNKTITLDKSGSRVTAILSSGSTAFTRELKLDAEKWLASQAPTDIKAVGTGLPVMYSYLSILNIKSMIGGTAVAILIISAILIGAFRSWKYGAISLLPNLLPGLVAFGVWGYLFSRVGVASSTVGAITLGIIVDDTVHLIWRYREARANGKAPEQAVTTMFEIVGRPMLISTLLLVSGFALLGISGFHITSALGVLSAIIVASALVFDWFLLGPLLITIDKTIDRRTGGTPLSQSANPFANRTSGRTLSEKSPSAGAA